MQLYFNYPGVLIWTIGRIFKPKFALVKWVRGGKGARDNGRGKEKKNDGTLSLSLSLSRYPQHLTLPCYACYEDDWSGTGHLC